MYSRYSIIKKENNSGITLIESIVAGVLVSITAGVILTIFHIFNKETTQMLMNAELQVQGEIILEEIARNTRLHHNVRCPYDSYQDSKENVRTTKHVGFYTSDDVNNTKTIYYVDYDTLQYLSNSNKANYRIGMDYATIIPFDSSKFVIDSGNLLSTKIVLTNFNQGIGDTLTLPEMQVRCRN